MIKLADLIEGKLIGSLYHSTSGENLISILKSNIMKIGEEANYGMTFTNQISFTRDKDYRPGDYTMEINGTKLSDNYKITPFAYYHGEREEAEEVVKESIKDIRRYIINIYANVETVQERPIQELERILKLYPGLKFTIGGEMGRDYNTRSETVREIPKAEALTYIKYNKY